MTRDEDYDGTLAAPVRKPYKLTLARDIKADDVTKVWLVDGFLAHGETSIWFGEPGCGKSTIKLDAACHVAAGQPWCGRAVTQGAVLYVAAERGMLVRRRTLAWRAEHGIDDFPLCIIDDVVDLRGKVDGERIIDAAKRLGEMTGMPVVWIIFDTLSRVMAGGDENSSRDMGQLIASVDRIHRETGAHCSLVHHVPLNNGTRMRGHGSMSGAVDMTYMISKADGVATIEADKANDLADDDKPKQSFVFESIQLADGMSASVMMPTDNQASTKAKGRSAPKGKAKIALRALHEAIAECGEIIVSDHAPANTKAVSTDMWREYAIKRGISEGGDRAKQLAFQRARAALLNTRHTGTWDDQNWVANKSTAPAGPPKRDWSQP